MSLHFILILITKYNYDTITSFIIIISPCTCSIIFILFYIFADTVMIHNDSSLVMTAMYSSTYLFIHPSIHPSIYLGYILHSSILLFNYRSITTLTMIIQYPHHYYVAFYTSLPQMTS